MHPNKGAKTARPIEALILDMDGVLWRGDQPIGDLPSRFTEIRRRGMGVVLATNNATLAVEQYLEKLTGFGVGLESWQIVNSSQSAAHYLSSLHPKGGPVFIVGESGLYLELARFGFFPAEENVLAVIAGLDRTLTYEKLTKASQLIRAGAVFIGTNPDLTYPAPEGVQPGAGAVLAFIEAAAGKSPLVTGKPAPEMYRLALKRLGTSPAQTLVVGDRLETDIAGAQALGCRTALVLSGISTRQQAERWQPALEWIATDLGQLLESL